LAKIAGKAWGLFSQTAIQYLCLDDSEKIDMQFNKIREAQKISFKDAADDTGINIGRVERGEANLTITTLESLCSYYKIKASTCSRR